MKAFRNICVILFFSVKISSCQSSSDKVTITSKPDFGKLFIEAINSESKERQAIIIDEIFSQTTLKEKQPGKVLDFIRKMHADFAPLFFHHSDISEFKKPDGSSFVMHVYAKNPKEIMWKDFQFYLDPLPPYKILKIAFIAEIAEPINLPNGSIEQNETLDWLNNYIEKLKSENALYGSIIIAKGKQMLFEKYFGYADTEKIIPITNKTLFDIASGGKMFTALGIAQLVEKGTLNYEDKVTKYLNGFSDKEKAEKLTIHQLLSHTSGLKEYWSGHKSNDAIKSTPNNENLQTIYKSAFDFEPGTAYTYCNTNFFLLGQIIEKVTGVSFYDYVQDNIFNRAGMNASGYFNYGTRGIATPLVRGKNENEWVEAPHGIKGSSAGGAYSNATDILRFSRALRNNLIVSKETFLNMVTAKISNMKTTEDYGYGFIIQKWAQELSYGHGGTSAGVNFEFRYFPQQDITLVVFCNQNNGAYDDLKNNTLKLISGDR